MLKGCGTYEFCEKYAEKFNVTSIVLKNRLNALKYEIYQYIEQEVDLDNIKFLSKTKQENLGISIKSFNDLENERFLSLINVAI